MYVITKSEKLFFICGEPYLTSSSLIRCKTAKNVYIFYHIIEDIYKPIARRRAVGENTQWDMNSTPLKRKRNPRRKWKKKSKLHSMKRDSLKCSSYFLIHTFIGEGKLITRVRSNARCSDDANVFTNPRTFQQRRWAKTWTCTPRS